MKKILLAVIAATLICSNGFANENSTPLLSDTTTNFVNKSSQKISYQVPACSIGLSQMFKIVNAHPKDNQSIYFLASENFDVDSTLNRVTQIDKKESEVFENRFIASPEYNKAIYTGMLHLVTKEEKPTVEALCSLTFTCKKLGEGYFISIQKNGARCNLEDANKKEGFYTVIANDEPRHN